MPNSKQIVYLSQSQYAELIANGTITVDGVTVTYDENDIYVTPQAEPVTDVRVAGTSVTANGVADIPVVTTFGATGAVKISQYRGLAFDASTGSLTTQIANEGHIKSGVTGYAVIDPMHQYQSTFYGLAKVAGHDEKNSTEPLGTYTPEAKGAIQSMLGVSDLIATAENNLVASKAYKVGDIFTANGKLYKVTTAITADEAIVLQNEGEEISGHNAEEVKASDEFVKKMDYATASAAGIVKVDASYGLRMGAGVTAGTLLINGADETIIKNYVNPNAPTASKRSYMPLTPSNSKAAIFYGMADLAGDVTQPSSSNAVGQYTDTAKSAIRTMIGASSTNVIAVQDTQPTDTDTKIWLPETAETPVQIPTMDDLGNYVQKTDIATTDVAGIVKTSAIVKLDANNRLALTAATDAHTKEGNNTSFPIMPNRQHRAAFYGLAKAAGDTTQAASDNAVGIYTDEAKAAIRTMVGAVGTEDYATKSTFGIVCPNVNQGIGIDSVTKQLMISSATEAMIKAGTNLYKPIVPASQSSSVFYGLATAAGDTTQSASSNIVGTYTDNAKASIKSMLGIVDGSTGTVDITGTTPTITAVENTRYVCGEVTSLSFTPPASGISIVRFTSGSTVTVLTLPSTVKFPEWFDSTSLETNTIYEICITDGVYGAVMSWAQ